MPHESHRRVDKTIFPFLLPGLRGETGGEGGMKQNFFLFVHFREDFFAPAKIVTVKPVLGLSGQEKRGRMAGMNLQIDPDDVTAATRQACSHAPRLSA